MTAYPLALRNQPQWLEVANFLQAQLLARLARSASGVLARGGRGPHAVGRVPAPGGHVSSIPDGNHGDNTSTAIA